MLIILLFAAAAASWEMTEAWTYEQDGVEYHVTHYVNRFTGMQRVTSDSDIGFATNEINGRNYTITAMDKDANGNLLPESKKVYSGTYLLSPAERDENINLR